MPQASAQTTAGWQAALQQLERAGGVLDLTPVGQSWDHGDGPGDAAETASGNGEDGQEGEPAGWRGRLLALEEEAIVVEAPERDEASEADPTPAEGQRLAFVLQGEVRRWSLRCRVLERFRFSLSRGRKIEGLRLSWPEEVQDAQRRQHFRVSTLSSTIPAVQLWRLEDPAACVAHEQYNRRRHVERRQGAKARREPGWPGLGPDWPGLGEAWRGLIVDVSGGGLCVALPQEAMSLVQKGQLLWAELPLPELEEPLYAVVRVVRSEPHSERVLRAGMAFYFEHHPRHERFITDRMCAYARYLERLQLQRQRGGRGASQTG
jgi:hypothetical protein